MSLIALADTYDRSQDADAKVKHQYQVAIADARKSFVKQDQAKLKALTPETKTLAKLDDGKLKKTNCRSRRFEEKCQSPS
ncbi:hypothetical protein [Lacticaseibacillus manihotivorans]|uniref:hypothetical protein n=1 Tax=Lacticaseibacillus manihotivorans TaxID=88233 RepID=UPI000A8652D5|nr:hypothetical protein [Lacticaseibacillus manihotivorans]